MLRLQELLLLIFTATLVIIWHPHVLTDHYDFPLELLQVAAFCNYGSIDQDLDGANAPSAVLQLVN